jgi:hypothetical protein
MGVPRGVYAEYRMCVDDHEGLREVYSAIALGVEKG